MATAEFSKFAGILSVALSQHHLLGFEIAIARIFQARILVPFPSPGDLPDPSPALQVLTGDPRVFSRVAAGFLSYNGKFRLPLLLAQGSPVFHSPR